MSEGLTFWDHLDELRAAIIRSLLVIVVAGIAAFFLKDWLFTVILAPHTSHFVSYRLLGIDEPFDIPLINTGLTEQFMIHMRVALYTGLLMASPYVLYQLFRFVSPGLYSNERKAALWMVSSAYLMFLLGTLVNYFLVFPLTVRFLGTYQVSESVENMLTLQSYADTFIGMSFILGAVFELPIVCAILAKMKLINGQIMAQFRRQAVVAILIVSAIITPSTDAFTLLVVALPIWGLYEVSIGIVKIINGN